MTSETGAETLMLRVTDLKQHEYCPRVVYYQYVMPVEFRATFKMERGRAVEGVEEALEKRRTYRRYRLAAARRSFRRRLISQTLGLSGTVDLLLETDDRAWPVDFKDTTQGVRRNHVLQIAAYSLLIEDCLAKICDAGFIYLVPERRVVHIAVGRESKQEVVMLLASLREMIGGQMCPPPTVHRNRCADCEYRNYCADVF